MVDLLTRKPLLHCHRLVEQSRVPPQVGPLRCEPSATAGAVGRLREEPIGEIAADGVGQPRVEVLEAGAHERVAAPPIRVEAPIRLLPTAESLSVRQPCRRVAGERGEHRCGALAVGRGRGLRREAPRTQNPVGVALLATALAKDGERRQTRVVVDDVLQVHVVAAPLIRGGKDRNIVDRIEQLRRQGLTTLGVDPHTAEVLGARGEPTHVLLAPADDQITGAHASVVFCRSRHRPCARRPCGYQTRAHHHHQQYPQRPAGG